MKMMLGFRVAFKLVCKSFSTCMNIKEAGKAKAWASGQFMAVDCTALSVAWLSHRHPCRTWNIEKAKNCPVEGSISAIGRCAPPSNKSSSLLVHCVLHLDTHQAHAYTAAHGVHEVHQALLKIPFPLSS